MKPLATRNKQQQPSVRVSLAQIVGGGYTRFWNSKQRYVAIKGSRGSKKSMTAGLRWISKLMEYPEANLLVVRKTFNTHKDSTFAVLLKAINMLGVGHLWDCTISPLEITYLPTGQKILFRGLDDPLKLTSITVEKGYLCWAWFEEAYEITKEDDFNKVDLSIRGKLPDGYFKQLVFTFNPWSENHWLKARFFDPVDDPKILAFTTTYKNNEFLGDDDRALFEWMRINKPKRYRIEGRGDWGISEGLIYDDYQELLFDFRTIAQRPGAIARNGLDFGYSADPTAFIATIVDLELKELYIYDEFYKPAMRNVQIADLIKSKGFGKERIIADSAEPKSIDEIRLLEVLGIQPAVKGPDSINNGIQFLQGFKIFVHPKCVNTIIEFNNYAWAKDKKTNKQINKPIDEYNHLMDALRYAVEGLSRPASPRVRSV